MSAAESASRIAELEDLLATSERARGKLKDGLAWALDIISDTTTSIRRWENDYSDAQAHHNQRDAEVLRTRLNTYSDMRALIMKESQ